MKIHGFVYLIVGAFIVGFSYYVTNVNENLDLQKFMLFVWIGGIFVVIGLFKLIAGTLSRARKPKIAKENFPHHRPAQQHAQHAQQNQQSNQFIKFCSKCGSAVRHFDSFCYKCGSRMFHRK